MLELIASRVCNVRSWEMSVVPIYTLLSFHKKVRIAGGDLNYANKKRSI